LWRAHSESILRQVVNEGLPLDEGFLCPRGSISIADILGPSCLVDLEPLDSCPAAWVKYPLVIGRLSMSDVASTVDVVEGKLEVVAGWGIYRFRCHVVMSIQRS